LELTDAPQPVNIHPAARFLQVAMKKLFTFKYARVVYGVIILIIGAVSMLLPMVPLGYAGLFVGAYLLHHRIPMLERLMNWLRKKDEQGRLQRFEDRVERFFQKSEEEKKEGD
jgi:hypothetical protein